MPHPDLAARLLAVRPRIAGLRLVAGFDGFVDERLQVVQARTDASRWTPMAGIADFAGWAAAAAGRSALREVVLGGAEAGGCAVNLADGAAALGLGVDLFATLGDPIHPAFAPVVDRLRSATPWTAVHGRTMAAEFGDGKLMLAATSQLAALTPAAVAAACADGRFRAACAGARILAFTNWTLYPHMTEVWRWLQRGPLADLPNRPRVFLDLVDPGGRAVQDLRAMLATARDFAVAGPVTLGLNRNEANQLARLLDLAPVEEDLPAMTSLAAALQHQLDLDEVVIHGTRGAAAADATGAGGAPGPWCAAPQRLTGAGDRFNAGWCLGHGLDWDRQDRLVLAGAVSGWFVRQARSPTVGELAAFLAEEAP